MNANILAIRRIATLCSATFFVVICPLLTTERVIAQDNSTAAPPQAADVANASPDDNDEVFALDKDKDDSKTTAEKTQDWIRKYYGGNVVVQYIGNPLINPIYSIDFNGTHVKLTEDYDHGASTGDGHIVVTEFDLRDMDPDTVGSIRQEKLRGKFPFFCTADFKSTDSKKEAVKNTFQSDSDSEHPTISFLPQAFISYNEDKVDADKQVGFQKRWAKACKHLITLAGGKVSKPEAF